MTKGIVKGVQSLVQRCFERFGSENTCYALCFLQSIVQFVSLQYFKESRFDFCYAVMVRGISFNILNLWLQNYSDAGCYTIDARSFRLLCVRGALMGVQQYYLHYAVKILPLHLTMVISNSMPVIIFVLNFVIYRYALSRREVLFILMCFSAIAVTICADQIHGALFEGETDDAASERKPHALENEVTGTERVLVSFWLFVTTVAGCLGIIIVKSAKTNVYMVNLTVGWAFLLLGASTYIQNVPPPEGAAVVTTGDNEYFYGFGEQAVFFVVYGLGMALCILIMNYATINVKDTGRVFLPQYLLVVYSVFYNLVVYNVFPNALEIGGLLFTLFSLYKLMIK